MQSAEYNLCDLCQQCEGDISVGDVWACRECWLTDSLFSFDEWLSTSISELEAVLGFYYNEMLREANLGFQLHRFRAKGIVFTARVSNKEDV